MYIYTYIYINSNKPLWCVDLTNVMPMQTYCTVVTSHVNVLTKKLQN